MTNWWTPIISLMLFKVAASVARLGAARERKRRRRARRIGSREAGSDHRARGLPQSGRKALVARARARRPRGRDGRSGGAPGAGGAGAHAARAPDACCAARSEHAARERHAGRLLVGGPVELWRRSCFTLDAAFGHPDAPPFPDPRPLPAAVADRRHCRVDLAGRAAALADGLGRSGRCRAFRSVPAGAAAAAERRAQAARVGCAQRRARRAPAAAQPGGRRLAGRGIRPPASRGGGGRAASHAQGARARLGRNDLPVAPDLARESPVRPGGNAPGFAAAPVAEARARGRGGRAARVSELRGTVRLRAAGHRPPAGGRRHPAAPAARRGDGFRSAARVPRRRQSAQDRLESEPAHEQADLARVSGRARSAGPVPGGLRAAHAREGRRMLALRPRAGCHAAARLRRACVRATPSD